MVISHIFNGSIYLGEGEREREKAGTGRGTEEEGETDSLLSMEPSLALSQDLEIMT